MNHQKLKKILSQQQSFQKQLNLAYLLDNFCQDMGEDKLNKGIIYVSFG